MIKSINAGISTPNFKQDSYGKIQQLGLTKNGRAVYQITDTLGNQAGLLSIPQEQQDKFEKAYTDIMDSAPKIQKYALENSTEKDIKQRKRLSRLIVTSCGVLGATIPLSLTQKSSIKKRLISTIGGIIAGVSIGFLSSLAATLPEGSLKFAKATRTFSKLDIQPIPTKEEKTRVQY